jgi:hypothetical protein
MENKIKRSIIISFASVMPVFVFAACDFYAHDHDWSQWYTIRDSTCAAEGEERRSCQGTFYDKQEKRNVSCDAIEIRAIPKDNSSHTWGISGGSITIQPTCTSPGTGTRYCTLGCGATETSPNNIPAKGHNAMNMVTTKTATCTSNGRREGFCSVCGQDIVESIRSLGHHWVNSGTGHALTKYKCSRCGIYSAFYN